MAYNYYSNLRLLTEQAAVALSATSGYATPRNSFSMKDSGFYGATQTSVAPSFVTPYESTTYGYWGNWDRYKVAENQFYYKSGSSYIPFKFVDKYSAPILSESSIYTYDFWPFYAGGTAQCKQYVLQWNATTNKINFKKYADGADVKTATPTAASSMDGYGCFILFSAGGGGGGGTGTVNNAGGSGGGGGATAFVYADLYALYESYPTGYIYIRLGEGGDGGVGGSNKTGQKGKDGTGSYLFFYSSTSSNNPIWIVCAGGKGGTWGGNNDKVDGGSGGTSVTIVEKDNSAPALPSFIKLLNAIPGGNGGKGGKGNVTVGASVRETTYSIPFDHTWKTPASKIAGGIGDFDVIGYGSAYSSNSGGGGASAISVNRAGYGQGGTGGAKSSAGNAGAGGGLIIFQNYFYEEQA